MSGGTPRGGDRDELPVVGHLISPYLFLTGSWIHGQIRNNPRYRAVVMTQRKENLEVFPFEPVYEMSPPSGPGLGYSIEKYGLARFPAAPYERVIEREGVVLLHAHLGWEAARTVHLKKRQGLPFVASFYGRDATLIPRKLYWRLPYRRLFSEGDLFVAEGRFMAETLVGIGCPREKVRVVHLGVDLERIPFAERMPAREGEIVGLITASFREKKGIPYALEAVARALARHPRLRLRLIGDGPMRPQIEARAAMPDLAGKVALLGYRSFPEYLDELKRAHFMMAPSVTARDGDSEGGAPVCVLEAQASGLPVIATEHCDIPEATVPEGSALLSPERDVERLAANLDRFLSNPESWPRMGRVGRAHVEAEFEVRRQGARMAEIYDEALRSGTLRRGTLHRGARRSP